MSPRASRRGAWWAVASSAGAALAVYAGALRGGFVYDDWSIVVDNPLVRLGSWRALLASSYWSRGQTVSAGGLYRPLTMATFALNARLAGLAPFSFHLVNVLLHAANAGLVAALGLTLGLPSLAAGLCGAAFAVIPIHTEAVSWAVGRAELLAAFFAISAWLCLHRARSWRRLTAGLALFAAALLSKESAAALPAALVLSEAAGTDEPFASVARERALVWGASLAVVGLYLEWRAFVLGSALVVGRPYFAGVGRLTALLTMARFFLAKWLAPMASGAGLCADYSRPVFPDARLSDPSAWVWLAAAVALAAWAAWDFARRRRLLSLGVLTLLALAAPLSNLLVPMEIIGAERIMYLPSVGFCLFLGALAATPRRTPALGAAAAIALAWWAWRTARRNDVWRSDDAFWAATAACAPGSPRVSTALGEAEDGRGHRLAARALYRQALAADPTLYQAAFGEARSYFNDGDDVSARQVLETLLARHPDARAWNLLGNVDERAGRPADAERDYVRALELDPLLTLARRNLGVLLYKRGRVDDAHAQLELYLSQAPPEAEAAEIRDFLRAGFKAADTAPAPARRRR